MSIQKQSGETLTEYQMRLYRNKDAYGLSNDDIGRILNEESDLKKDESAWRKYTYAFLDGYDYAMENLVDANLAISELREAQDELYKERVRLQDARREHRAGLRKQARFENLIEAIERNVEYIEQCKPLNIKEFTGEYTEEKTGVLLISDWHYGDWIEDFINQFNTEIFEQRLETLIEETRAICVKESFEKLIILNLGDLVSGNIHVSTRVNNEVDVITQVQKVSEYLAQMIGEILPTVPSIDFYSVVDNHSRTTPSKPDHIEVENFGRIMHWYLDARFAGEDRVKIKNNIINGFKDFDIGMVDIYGGKIIFTHGHNDKISTAIPDLSLILKEIPEAIMIGHLHRNFEEEEYDIDLIMNPSLIGANKYAKGIRKTSKPRQKLISYKNDCGKLKRDCTYLIDLR